MCDKIVSGSLLNPPIEKERLTLCQLPDEILGKISSFLDGGDKQALSYTNKRFRAIVVSNQTQDYSKRIIAYLSKLASNISDNYKEVRADLIELSKNFLLDRDNFQNAILEVRHKVIVKLKGLSLETLDSLKQNMKGQLQMPPYFEKLIEIVQKIAALNMIEGYELDVAAQFLASNHEKLFAIDAITRITDQYEQGDAYASFIKILYGQENLQSILEFINACDSIYLKDRGARALCEVFAKEKNFSEADDMVEKIVGQEVKDRALMAISQAKAEIGACKEAVVIAENIQDSEFRDEALTHIATQAYAKTHSEIEAEKIVDLIKGEMAKNLAKYQISQMKLQQI